MSREGACRSCGGTRLEPVLDLGRTPLANALLSEADLHRPEADYPLELVFCPDCTLLQITETVPPEVLFSEYLYFSSFSDTMVAHAKSLAGRLVRERGLGPGSLAGEVASNDGYLLQHYRELGVPVLGVEPAANIARVAESKGIPTVCRFFSEAAGREIAASAGRADVIHANNVLAHVADLNGFVEGLRLWLKEDGLVVVEAPYAKDMLDGVEFDTIYHEHLCYFSLTALKALFGRHGLEPVEVERLPIHGGSLRLFAGHAGRFPVGASVADLLAEERAWGVADVAGYAGFAARVSGLRSELTALLARLKGEGCRLAAYGASAKGSTLLNTFGIGPETLDFVADRSTVKQGLFTPGTHLPVVPPSALLDRSPDYTLLLTWNFADEILAQQSEYRGRGGRFIVPIPEVRVV